MENTEAEGIKLSVIVPVHNEEETLETLHSRLTSVMQELREPYEIIFIDDGSTDNSLQVLKGLRRQDRNVKLISFTRNFGQHPALTAGFDHARGDVVITIDADLQNPPEEIPKLLDKLDEGYELVFGVFRKRQHSAFRRAGSAFSKWVLSRIMPVPVTNLSGFRAVSGEAVRQLRSLDEKSKFLDGLLCWMGYRVGTVEVGHCARQAGKTKYNPVKLVAMWVTMLVSFTDMPLKIAIFGGFLLGLIGVLLALVYLIGYFTYGSEVPGFATIVILVTVFAGIQLFCLGILGEYIGRVNKGVKNRPEYIIRDKLWGDGERDGE
jgi:glycosyltransferase involved in cell wall biosynthesis